MRRAKTTSADQYSMQEFGGNESISDPHDGIPDKDILQENAELKEALLKKTPFQSALNQEHKFEVHKEKMVEIIDWLKKCKESMLPHFQLPGRPDKNRFGSVTSWNDK